MKLGLLYHTPFWQAPNGSLWEAEGSLARYIDSLAPYFDEVSLCAPVPAAPRPEGSRVRARNVRLAPLPYFDGPRHFYPQLPAILRHLGAWIDEIDILHCRVPTPAAFPAFWMARRRGVPTLLLVVGDLRGLLPYFPYAGVKRWLFRAYVAFEEWGLERMIRRSLTFANGAALRTKHERPRTRIFETKTTTITAEDINTRLDTCQRLPIRLLTVCRIDPRKGLRALPGALDHLLRAGKDVRLDVVGPTLGQAGEEEQAAVMAEARRLHVAERLAFLGPMPLDDLLPFYRHYDLFVLPTLPGEGIPRVLLEAMAAGLPVVTTSVAGIPSLIAGGVNGLLLAESSARTVADGLARLIDDPALRQRLVQHGYDTARAHTLERQAAWMMDLVGAELGHAVLECPRPLLKPLPK